MAHDVFISYSSKDKPTADAVCAMLESRGVRCWVAPRDILPGVEYAEALVDALQQSRLMVLVFSSGSNQSPHVLRECERAVSKGIPILPLRIEDVPPSRAMEYYIASRHWLDALTPPLERHLEQLAETAKLLLSRSGPTSERESPQPARPAAVGVPAAQNFGGGGVQFDGSSGMAPGAVLPRIDGHHAIAEALDAIAASILRLGEAPQVQRARAAVAAHPRRVVAVLAALLVMSGVLVAWINHQSNPLRQAELALEKGRPESVLRYLEGVRNNPKAALLKGRALYALKRPDEGIAQYKEAAETEPQLLANPTALADLSQSLGGRHSQEAADLMVQAGESSVDLLAEASRDSQSSRRRWAAIEALKRMKREDRADLFSAYVVDLRSHDCATSSKAAKALGELGDKRAVAPLREVSQRKSLFFDACEVPAARAALRKLEKK